MIAKDEFTRQEYEKRINQVMNFINAHLDHELSIDVLAEVSCFSKYHFHRIFTALVGETLHGFTRRLRLERAARMLVFDRRLAVTQVAMACGFSSSQNFSKAFRAHFGIAPRAVRQAMDFRRFETLGKIGELTDKNGNKSGKPGKAPRRPRLYHEGASGGFKIAAGRKPMDVKVKVMPAFRVAYARHVGPYDPKLIGPLFGTLFRWAGPRGLCTEKSLVLGVSWDNPSITPENKCRYDACLTVGDDVKSQGSIDVQSIPGGSFAVYRCQVLGNDFQKPWTELMRDWLPDSGYQPDERPCYEIYYNDAAKDPQGKWIVDLCLPVKLL